MSGARQGQITTFLFSSGDFPFAEYTKFICKCLWKITLQAKSGSQWPKWQAGCYEVWKGSVTLIERRAKQNPKEGDVHEGPDCSVRASRTADCRTAPAGLRQRRDS